MWMVYALLVVMIFVLSKIVQWVGYWAWYNLSSIYAQWKIASSSVISGPVAYPANLDGTASRSGVEYRPGRRFDSDNEEEDPRPRRSNSRRRH
jgi:hypothetical protein